MLYHFAAAFLRADSRPSVRPTELAMEECRLTSLSRVFLLSIEWTERTDERADELSRLERMKNADCHSLPLDSTYF